MTSKTSKTDATNTKRKNRAAVAAITTNRLDITEAFTRTWAWWDERHLLEDLNTDDFRNRLHALIAASADLGIVHLGALFQSARQVITAAAEVPSLTQYATPQQRHRAHRTRNLVTALLWTLAWTEGHNPCSLVDDMPAIAPRTSGPHRPAYDDEILLLRLRALYRLQRPPRLASAGFMYALSETGAWPIETTRTLITDFDSLTSPGHLTIRPDATRTDTIARELPLPRWAQQALRPALAPSKWRDQTDQRCAFKGSDTATGTEHNSPSVTSTQVLGRAMAEVGLDDALTSEAITYWRAAVTKRTQGITAAANLIGFTEQQGVERLRRVLDRDTPVAVPQPHRQVRSFIGL